MQRLRLWMNCFMYCFLATTVRCTSCFASCKALSSWSVSAMDGEGLARWHQVSGLKTRGVQEDLGLQKHFFWQLSRLFNLKGNSFYITLWKSGQILQPLFTDVLQLTFSLKHVRVSDRLCSFWMCLPSVRLRAAALQLAEFLRWVPRRVSWGRRCRTHSSSTSSSFLDPFFSSLISSCSLPF